jgi:hypothetical protein
MGHGHKIPSGTESMRMVGARKIECEVWFIKDYSFAVYSADGLITLQHHRPERLIAALMSPNVLLPSSSLMKQRRHLSWKLRNEISSNPKPKILCWMVAS